MNQKNMLLLLLRYRWSLLIKQGISVRLRHVYLQTDISNFDETGILLRPFCGKILKLYYKEILGICCYTVMKTGEWKMQEAMLAAHNNKNDDNTCPLIHAFITSRLIINFILLFTACTFP